MLVRTFNDVDTYSMNQPVHNKFSNIHVNV